MTSSKDDLTDEDINLFRKAAKGTTPLRQHKKGNKKVDITITTPNKKRGSSPSVSRSEEDSRYSHLHEINYDATITEEVTAADILNYSRPGPQNKLLRKLRRGQLPIEDTLDLHGLRVTGAYSEIMRFINHSLSSGYRCIKIIHGKGRGAQTDKPILKNKVNNWLKQIPQVMAFCSAQPSEGGIGAVYILLKKVQ